MRERNVKFEYYKVYAMEYNRDTNTAMLEEEYNLREVLEVAYQRNVMDRVFEVYNEEARLQTIERDAINPNLWKMNFIRIRDCILPGIATNNGEYEPMRLDEDEYLGEEVSVLYDTDRNILMMQRNKNSLSPTGIAEYFTRAFNDNRYLICFKPIPNQENIRNVQREQTYRKITIGFTPNDVDETILNEESSLKSIISKTKRMNVKTVSIVLSMGNARRDASINNNDIEDVLTLAGNNMLKKAQMSRRNVDDTKVEIVDLIEDKLYDIEIMEYDKTFLIEYARVIEVMKNLYYNKIELFDRLYRRE